MSREINRKSVYWVAEEVAAFLKYQCVEQPTPQFAPALRDIWANILEPFFAGSLLGDQSHGRLLENFKPLSSVRAPLGIRNSCLVDVTDVCGAIAYVLSTSDQSIPSKKHLMLASVFAHFCRLAPPKQRPRSVHILWPTGGTSGFPSTQENKPIILVSSVIYVSIDYNAPATSNHSGYQRRTLRDLLSSKGLQRSSVSEPSCDCSRLIPAIASLNGGRAVTGFSADFDSLLYHVKAYKRKDAAYTEMKAAARPACDVCQVLMSQLRLLYTDLGIDEYGSGDSASSDYAPPLPAAGSSGSPTAYPAGGPYQYLNFSPPDYFSSIPVQSPIAYAAKTATYRGVTFPVPPPSNVRRYTYPAASPSASYPYNPAAMPDYGEFGYGQQTTYASGVGGYDVVSPSSELTVYQPRQQQQSSSSPSKMQRPRESRSRYSSSSGASDSYFNQAHSAAEFGMLIPSH